MWCGISAKRAAGVALHDSMRACGVMALAFAAAACADPSERMTAEQECTLRVIVGLGAPSGTIDVASFGTVAGAQVRLVERLLPDLAVLELSARGHDGECAAALERLRAHPAIRSAEAEQRRAPHPG